MACAESGCARRVHCKSLCDRHYRAMRFTDPVLREERLARNRAYRSRHLARIRGHERRRYLLNPERRRKNNRASYARDREGYAHRTAKRRSALNGAVKHHTRAEWSAKLAAYDFRCGYCGSLEKLARDHIVPLSRGGSDEISNIVPACKPCNSSKHARTLREWLEL